MITNQIAKINRYKKQLATLEDKVASGLKRELAGLPRKYGFETAAEFIDALKAAIRGKNVATRPAKKELRKRAKITPDTKQKVKLAFAAGQTGNQIAKHVGISLPSVQNIKKELGLVKTRK